MSLSFRLKEYIDSQRITIKEFERRNKLSNGLIARIVRENGHMSTRHLEVIGKNNPDLSMDWLIKGIGDMLIDENEIEEHEIDQKLQYDVEFYKKMVTTLQKAVDMLTD